MEEAEEEGVGYADVEAIVLFILINLLLILLALLVNCQIELPEHVGVARNILHSSEAIFDLSLQISMHEEGGDHARDEDGEGIGGIDLGGHELADDEADHEGLDDDEGDGSLEH